MKNFVRNHKEKGYPDSHHVPDGNSSSSSSAMSMGGSSTLPRPAGYPNTIEQGTQNSSLIQPPIAYPYAAHPVNVGHNQNKGGMQKLGNVRIGNRAAGSELASSPVTIPENINAGCNTNEGGDQETGDIEIVASVPRVHLGVVWLDFGTSAESRFLFLETSLELLEIANEPQTSGPVTLGVVIRATQGRVRSYGS
ncbi:hypothetical protein Cgig2_021032 [Carnegiea gigantea]|uniref:Uncharacterized protein n=1 Tax=Carnegiea gigantea TaxID=171969 RepID=A0A9Q1GJ31_9CARY|nr:hypothetical protein Cgig2_021032 [Carnegiea gigantea]